MDTPKAISDRQAAIARLVRAGQLEQALGIASDWVAKAPSSAAWTTLAQLQMHVGARVAAIDAARRATRLSPVSFEPGRLLARLLLTTGRSAEASAEMDRIAALARTPTEHNALGVLLNDAQRHRDALGYFEKARDGQPDSEQFTYNLAMCLRMTGDITGAIEVCDALLRRHPAHSGGYYLRSDLRPATSEDNRISAMNRLLQRGQSWIDERNLRFALARECEDTGDFAQSFEHCARGNRLQRLNMRYDVSDDIAVIDRIIATHTADALEATVPGWSSERPIFILGLPRTGTTLIERILGSHSEVHAAGERDEFTMALGQLGSRSAAAAAGGDRVAAALSLDMAELGRTYERMLEPVTGGARRFIDKQPLNYLYCGLIARAMPGASIILVERNPMDSCYAIYKTLFGGAYPFSYDLADLGRYYLAYRRLVDHWRQVLGSCLLIVRYEEVVSDFDNQARRLVSFAGLQWQDACRDFHSSTAPSQTASASQVRRPVYSSSVEKWRHYQAQLRPLIDMLKNAGIRVD